MNIVVIHNSYQRPGGEDVVVAQETALLERHGHRVTHYQRSNREIESLSFGEKLGLISRIISAGDSKLCVREILRDLKPDLVHVHNTFALISPSVYETCHEENVPVVQTLHNYRLMCPAATFYRNGKVCEECPTNGLQRSLRYGCYHNSRVQSGAIALMLKAHRLKNTWNERVDAYIALSHFQKARFAQSGIPAGRIHVKPNFVEPDPGERTERSDGGRRRYVLFVGRLSVEKGLSVLLKAWNRLHEEIPLVIVGDGPMRPYLEKEVKSKGLRSVFFAGLLNRSDVYDAMKSAAFVVVPSVWQEPFGLNIVEAFACGTPVLGASIGAIGEMVDDNRTGMHFAPDDPDSLANKVTSCWTNSAKLEAMGREARRVYRERYTGNSTYPRLMDIYASAIETHFRRKKKQSLRTAA
jgi:glycosyltransferase involved in cell wall biosynthesis